jgi:outer membrane protein OmpA-like peptidoglycan-associated protein
MMNSKIRLLAAGITAGIVAAACPHAAFADPTIGPYAALGVGAQYAPPTASTSYKIGPAYVGELGWSFGNGWRTELEAAYAGSKIDKVNHVAIGGNLHVTSFLLNGLYDFDHYPLFGLFVPHAGAGVGLSDIHAGGFGVPGHSPGLISENTLTLQGIAGLDYAFTPALKLDVDYRMVANPDVKYVQPSGVSQGDILDNSVVVQLRYDFGALPAAPVAEASPAPAPEQPAPPAAQPEAQRAFQVFFDFNKSDITSDAAAIISQAAQTAVSGRVAKIQVTGHTDTVGTVKYNQKLSERRAAAVKAELIKDGVSADTIATVGVGKSGLLVPTPDGVREPQNRRAEIELQ